MATPRDAPYIWVTWITRLMAGEAHCEWAAWFRAHHTYGKLPSAFDVTKWTAEHTALVRERAVALRADGYSVFVEEQNAFKSRRDCPRRIDSPPLDIAPEHDLF
jgi:hypothetical protein